MELSKPLEVQSNNCDSAIGGFDLRARLAVGVLPQFGERELGDDEFVFVGRSRRDRVDYLHFDAEFGLEMVAVGFFDNRDMACGIKVVRRFETDA